MTERRVVMSDLSGQIIDSEDDRVSIWVFHHQPLGEEIAVIDATKAEAKHLAGLARDGVLLTFFTKDGNDGFTMEGDPPPDLPRNIIVDREVFEAEFQGNALEILRSAIAARADQRQGGKYDQAGRIVEEKSQQRGKVRKAGGAQPDKVDYTLIENAGQPHRGRCTEAEQRVVRENLDEVNRRREANGHAPIDPLNPKDASRYGFGTDTSIEAEEQASAQPAPWSADLQRPT